MARAELIKDATFLKLLTQLQDTLSRDNFLYELKAINTSLSESIRGTGFNSPNPGLLAQLRVRGTGSGKKFKLWDPCWGVWLALSPGPHAHFTSYWRA